MVTTTSRRMIQTTGAIGAMNFSMGGDRPGTQIMKRIWVTGCRASATGEIPATCGLVVLDSMVRLSTVNCERGSIAQLTTWASMKALLCMAAGVA